MAGSYWRVDPLQSLNPDLAPQPGLISPLPTGPTDLRTVLQNRNRPTKKDYEIMGLTV